MILIGVILLWAIYAYFDAKEEVAWTYPFRTFDWMQFEPQKGKQSRIAHRSGAVGVFIQLVLSAGLFAIAEHSGSFQSAIAPSIACFLASGLTYWLVFDIAYAKGIGKDWDYLGDTAATDKFIKNGKVKAIVCGVLIVAIVILYNIF